MRLSIRTSFTALIYLSLASGLSAQLHYQIDHAAFQTADSGALSAEAPRHVDGSDTPVKAPSGDDCPTCHQLANGSSATIVLPVVSFLNDKASKPARTAPEQRIITRLAYAPSAPRAPPSL